MESRRSIFLDFTIILTLFVLMSLFCIWTASYYAGLRIADNGLFYIKRHVIMLIIGLFVYRFTAKMNVRQLLSVSYSVHLVSMFLLFLVLIPGLGVMVNGARQWLNIGFTRFQPSEWAKLSLIIYLTAEFTRIAMDKFGNSRAFLERRALVVTAITAMLVLMEKDFTTALFMIVFFGVIYFVSSPKLTMFWVTTCGLAVMTGVFLSSGAAYRIARVHEWYNFIIGKTGPAAQLKFSLLAFSHGGISGVGYGAGEYKKMLPEAHTDFMFAVMGEELGFIFLLAIVALYIIVLIKLFFMIKASTEAYQFYLTVLALILFVGQAIINIGVTVGVFPITGMTLPILSYGRTSVIMFMILLGLLRSIEKDIIRGK